MVRLMLLIVVIMMVVFGAQAQEGEFGEVEVEGCGVIGQMVHLDEGTYVTINGQRRPVQAEGGVDVLVQEVSGNTITALRDYDGDGEQDSNDVVVVFSCENESQESEFGDPEDDFGDDDDDENSRIDTDENGREPLDLCLGTYEDGSENVWENAQGENDMWRYFNANGNLLAAESIEYDVDLRLEEAVNSVWGNLGTTRRNQAEAIVLAHRIPIFDKFYSEWLNETRNISTVGSEWTWVGHVITVADYDPGDVTVWPTTEAYNGMAALALSGTYDELLEEMAQTIGWPQAASTLLAGTGLSYSNEDQMLAALEGTTAANIARIFRNMAENDVVTIYIVADAEGGPTYTQTFNGWARIRENNCLPT